VWLSEGVGVGVGVGVSELEEESVGVGVLLDGVGEGDVVGVCVGVDEEMLLGDVVFAGSDDVEGIEVVAAADPNNPPVSPPKAELTPPSRSFFSTTSRRKGFELYQLACANAKKMVIRVKTRNCCCRENIFVMILCV
jgi:hypothetical protein